MSGDERWLPVVGFDGYEVSDLGRVRSTRSPGSRGPNHRRRDVPVVLKPWPSQGYSAVTLRSCGRSHARAVHLLVLEAFVGPAPEGQQAAHWNGDRTDAQLANLRWTTRADNEADKQRHGTSNAGERHGMAKLTDAQVAEIRQRGTSAARIADEFGITANYARSILTGRARRDVEHP